MRAVLSSATPSPTCWPRPGMRRSEEHTSELQSLQHLVCRLLLEKKIYHPDVGVLNAPRHALRLPTAMWLDSPRAIMPSVFFFLMIRRPRSSTFFPYPRLSR